MDGTLVLIAFFVLALLATAVWVWVLAGTRREMPYADLSPKVAALRRRLLYLVLAVAVAVFAASMFWLPYPEARSATLGDPEVTVEVTGIQWAWLFSRQEVPAGVPVEFRVTSNDVNHGFAIYDPGGKLVAQVQAMPGYTNRLIHTFEDGGAYTVRCLEYCGLGHHVMDATLTVVR